MIVKKLIIKLSLEESIKREQMYTYKFYLRTRHILNYIEREYLKPLKYRANFDAICIDLRQGFGDKYMNVAPYISPSNTLEVVLPFSKEVYDALSSDEAYYSYIQDYLTQGLKTCQVFFDIPIDGILSSYQDFVAQGCINSWIIKEKCIDRKEQIKVILKGNLCMTNFTLDFIIIKKGKVFYSKQIFTSDPDEVSFSKWVKELTFQNHDIFVIRFDGKVMYKHKIIQDKQN